MTKYVVGFLFSPDKHRVVLIRKNRPKWQAGRLNGVGGHIEDGESPLTAMRREFFEETGVAIDNWNEFARMESSDAVIYVFRASDENWYCVDSVTDEVVDTFLPSDIQGGSQDTVSNLPALISLALLPDGNPRYTTIQY